MNTSEEYACVDCRDSGWVCSACWRNDADCECEDLHDDYPCDHCVAGDLARRGKPRLTAVPTPPPPRPDLGSGS